VQDAVGDRGGRVGYLGHVALVRAHDRVGELLGNLRSASEEFTPPESACFSYRELYRRLAELEQRTHEHIHVENNVYFPRAVALEET